MIVPNDAFDELLDRAALVEEEGEASGGGEARRRQFALEVDRAVKNVRRAEDGRDWYCRTLRRHGCRLYFFRCTDRLYLVACVPIPRCSERDRPPPPLPERSAK